jgi:hypothetical protein
MMYIISIPRQNQERGVEGLRRELKAAEAQIDEMKAQHSAWVG